MTYEKLKEEYERRKLESAKAQVRLQQIKERWLKDYNTENPEEIAKILERLKADLDTARKDYQNLLEKCENELLKLESGV